MGTGGFHPELEKAARWLPKTVLTRRSFPFVRFAFKLAARLAPQSSQTIGLETGRRIQLHAPRGRPTGRAPALLWIHGGGLVIGDPRLEEKLCAGLSEDLGLIVAAPDYRLAPDHPYPAALEDLDAALSWLADRPGVDPARIAIGGDSAGGGLAACLALRAAKRDGPQPCFLLLHEPMLDEAARFRPDPDPAKLRLWNGAANRFGWGAYLAGLDGAAPPTASAARASGTELAALPPTWLGIGTADLFHAETTAFAARLAAAGKLHGLVTVPGGFHGFATFAAKAPVSRGYLAEMKSALTQGLGLDAG